MGENSQASGNAGYNRFLLLVAGLGGLLYGIDVGIIAGALPYLQATSGYTPAQLSTVVAAVLLGSVFSSLFAGMLADAFGRRWIMVLGALLFILSIPVITLSDSLTMLVTGRLLQGVSGGLIGVVVPLYLAECLSADSRGRGTGMFQLLLTAGLVVSALAGLYFAREVGQLESTPGVSAETLFAARDSAWRQIFWVSLFPGILFFAGALAVSESPRWLFRKGRRDACLAALARSGGEDKARAVLLEMEQTEAGTARQPGTPARDSLLQRKYAVPFLLALVILACTQATGVNSVFAYAVDIFQQAGLTGTMGNQGNVILTIVNCVMTVVAVALVDRKGRTFLLKMGTAGIFIALVCAALTFRGIESKTVDVTSQVMASSADTAPRTFALDLQDPQVRSVLDAVIPSAAAPSGTQVTVAYRYGPYASVAHARSLPGSHAPAAVRISPPAPADLADSVIGRFFRSLGLNPFKDMSAAADMPLEITSVRYGAIPDPVTGWIVAGCFILFVASFASGPGVCVWLALSELMPTRIRSNGMSIALLVNQLVSTTIAATFLPVVSSYGYSVMFGGWAACTVIYFITAAFFLPETRGKTLEEIEEHFTRRKKA